MKPSTTTRTQNAPHDFAKEVDICTTGLIFVISLSTLSFNVFAASFPPSYRPQYCIAQKHVCPGSYVATIADFMDLVGAMGPSAHGPHGPMGPMDAWVPWAQAPMGPWAQGPLVPWAQGLMGHRAHRPKGPWAQGTMGPRAHG